MIRVFQHLCHDCFIFQPKLIVARFGSLRLETVEKKFQIGWEKVVEFYGNAVCLWLGGCTACYIRLPTVGGGRGSRRFATWYLVLFSSLIVILSLVVVVLCSVYDVLWVDVIIIIVMYGVDDINISDMWLHVGCSVVLPSIDSWLLTVWSILCYTVADLYLPVFIRYISKVWLELICTCESLRGFWSCNVPLICLLNLALSTL